MRISRAPLRITLGGGGTDLAEGGYCIAAAIDKYVTIAVTESFDDNYVLRYSENERVTQPADIQHRIFRATIERFDIKPGIEISSTADIPAGTGLGSSGAFTVALLRALLPDASRPELARIACELDIGKQDQHAAVYGGVNGFDFGMRQMQPLETEIDRHLGLYYTGRTHSSEEQLAGITIKRDMRLELDTLKAITENDIALLGDCLYRQWTAKCIRQPIEFHRQIDLRIGRAMERGATGGKLVGSGDGGFVLIVNDNEEIADYFKRQGYRRVPFRFDHAGVTRLV